MKLPRPVVRTVRAFLSGPASVRSAVRVIVTATLVTTVGGGVLMWALDRKDFPTLGDSMWWALQTVTTVGYGDVTPKNGVGRVIGGLVLVYAVAFLAILTAAITTSFVQKAQEKQGTGEQQLDRELLARLDDVAARLDRLEKRLDAQRGDREVEHPTG